MENPKQVPCVGVKVGDTGRNASAVIGYASAAKPRSNGSRADATASARQSGRLGGCPE